MLLNCRNPDIKLECAYGKNKIDMNDVLTKIKDLYIADDSCNNYTGDVKTECSKENKCKDCANGEKVDKEVLCAPIPFVGYKIKEFGKIWAEKEDE